MKLNYNINTFRLCIYASVIAAVLIAITVVLPSVADNVDSADLENSSDIDIVAKKTAEWTDDSHSKGQVEITADATGRDESVPNVLFVGTLCSAHGLTRDTIIHSLNSIKESCNVDWWLCNNSEPSFTGNDRSGSRIKGGPDITTADIPELPVSNHQALQKFFNHIYEMNSSLISKTGKPYDFIVLEFDGTRISDWYRGLRPDDDPDSRSPTGNYDKYSNEKATVDMLKTFYENRQVIWITDMEVDESDPLSGYHPSTAMNVRGNDVHTRVINYNSLKGLLAPSLYVDTSDTPASSDSDLRLIEAGLSDAPVDAEHTLGFDRQVGYNNSSQVGQFLKDAIASLYEYQIVIEDKIDMSDNIKIIQDSVSFEKWDSESRTWIPVPDVLKPIVNVNYETGEITASVANLKGDNKFRIILLFEDKSSIERFIYTSKDGDPNDGPAEVSVIPGAGETKVEKPETTIPLDWEIPIYYVVEDDFKTDPRVSVTNPEDYISTSASSKPSGSEAKDREDVRFQFWTTIVDGEEIYVSNLYEFVPQPDPETNRYVSTTYYAHFAEVPEETKHLTVNKVWSDGDDFHLNDQITVHLYADDADLGAFVMDAESNWTYTTIYEYQIMNHNTGMPFNYYFVEEPVDGYSASYVVDESDPRTLGNTEITNTYVPGPAPSPTPDPGKVTPAGHSPVKTADITNLMALAIVAGVGLICILIVSRVKSRKNKKRG